MGASGLCELKCYRIQIFGRLEVTSSNIHVLSLQEHCLIERLVMKMVLRMMQLVMKVLVVCSFFTETLRCMRISRKEMSMCLKIHK